MSTYTCMCGNPATWFLREAVNGKVAGEYMSAPLGWSYATCDEHMGSVMAERAPRRVLAFALD
jgi:hypothetical protein